MSKFLMSLLFFCFLLYKKIGLCECDPAYFYQNSSNFFIELEGFQASPIKEETINILGNIKIKQRIYKNSVAKLKVKLYWGENLIFNWKSLVLDLLGFSENSLKDLEIDKMNVKIYEKENYKAIIFPLIETSDSGFIIVFTSKGFSLEEMINLIKKFPLSNSCLSP